jgi:hypothetical protein
LLLLGLLAALLTYATWRVQQLLAAHKEQTATLKAAVGGRRAADVALVGGGAGAISVPALARAPAVLPAWNQLADPLADGRADPQAYTDCGWECCAMVLHWCHGVTMPAGDVRMLVGGWQRPGLSDGPDLVKGLAAQNVSADLHTGTANELDVVLRRTIADGRPAIVLGHWITEAVLHWVAATAISRTGVVVHDPWGGHVHEIPWADFRALIAGQIVTVNGAIRAPAGRPPVAA